ncbi:MAG TPA: hypothetical protein DIU00_04980 [Phycisphaerales bacterium]|nr:hypothetical protein [Phycisphaerales bacterium]
MRAVDCLKIAIVGSVLLVLVAGCNEPDATGIGRGMSLVFEADFEDGNLDAWQATDSGAWQGYRI